MKITTGTKVLITGSASGIGKIMGRMVLEKGGEWILWDINQSGIDQTISEFSALGKITGYQVDVMNESQVVETADKLKKTHGNIDILINNAGIVVGKYFHEHSLSDIRRSMEINSIALMLITHQFLPDMMAKKSGHICNITSSAGLISNPKMSVYAASKWAATGWSDSVRLEMQKLKTGVNITIAMPYYINTGMFDGVKSSIIPILKPEYAARRIIKAIEKNKIQITMPLSYYFIRICQGVLPIWAFDFVAGKVLGIYHTMDEFKGRN